MTIVMNARQQDTLLDARLCDSHCSLFCCCTMTFNRVLFALPADETMGILFSDLIDELFEKLNLQGQAKVKYFQGTDHTILRLRINANNQRFNQTFTIRPRTWQCDRVWRKSLSSRQAPTIRPEARAPEDHPNVRECES